MAEVTAEFPGPEYPNSPLQSVVFEIRFPGEPAVECHRDRFFNVAREEFPLVLVPKIEPGAAAALSPYRFERESREASLLTALNLFAFQTTAYPGFPRFSHDALSWVRRFGELFKIDRLTRTGLRYSNIIPYAPGQVFPVANFLNVGMKLGMVESSSFSRFSLSAVIPGTSGGSLTVQIQELESQDGAESAILLDLDYALTGPNLRLAEIEQYLNQSRHETKQVFEGLLTDGYRKFLRGEGLK